MNQFTIAKIVAVAALGVAAQSAFAIDGTVNFKGKIIEAPCSIAGESKNQNVELGTISTAYMATADGTKSTPVPFVIKLMNCGETATGATVTFSGPPHADNAAYLAVGLGETDPAVGVGIEVLDSAGSQIANNAASANYSLGKGDFSLQFKAGYVTTKKDTVKSGSANAVANFTIAYK